MTQTADKKRIEPFVIKRSVKSAVEAIINQLKTLQIDEKYMITISHAGAAEKAAQVLQQFKSLPDSKEAFLFMLLLIFKFFLPQTQAFHFPRQYLIPYHL